MKTLAKKALLAVAALCAAAGAPASAADIIEDMPLESAVVKTSWHLIGPALSWHSDTRFAPVVQRKQYSSLTYVDGQPVITPAVDEKLAWNERHIAIGLSRSTRDVIAGETIRDFGQILEDSYGKLGLMAGRSWSWDLYEGDALRLEAGVAVGAWWRTSGLNYRVENADYQDGYYTVTRTHRRLLPFALPVATLTHKPTGIEAALSFVPKSSINEYHISSTNVLMLQVSFPIQ